MRDAESGEVVAEASAVVAEEGEQGGWILLFGPRGEFVSVAILMADSGGGEVGGDFPR